MQYLIFDYGSKNGQTRMMTRMVAKEDRDYVQETILPSLRPLSEEDYCYGPAGILDTGARYSYVLDGDELLWCIEWEPGLLVIRFSPDGTMAWSSLRSPHPGFGGREASEEEMANFDEDVSNPQYNLVFTAWDAEMEPKERGKEWAFINQKVQRRWDAAIEPVNKLAERLHAEVPTEEARSAWQTRCEKSPIWQGKDAMA